MRRLAIVLVAGMLLASIAGPVSAAKPPLRGFLPPGAQPHGYSLIELATAWNAWAFSAPPEDSPFLEKRCEQSPIDPRIWLLPKAHPYGGPPAITCEVPQGAFLVLPAFDVEWSQAELGYPATEAELRAAVEDTFALLDSVEVTFNGTTATRSDLAAYVVVTDLDTLPADNLFGADPTDTMNKGLFLVIAPLSRGTHTLDVAWSVPAYDVAAALTITLEVH